MITHIPGRQRLSLKGFGLFVGSFVLSTSVAMAQNSVPVVPVPVVPVPVPPPPPPPPPVTQVYTGIHLYHGPESFGTLGYGPPGLHPGEQGFGLGYHLGYGYGGNTLGVGADGGYPFYGGPGYPHPNPQLQRIGGIVPFPYFGGPGCPTPHNPNFYGGGGPVVPDRPVVAIVSETGQPVPATDYGVFTGAAPEAEARFAPFTARAAAGAASRRPTPSRPGLPAAPPTSGRVTPAPPATNPAAIAAAPPPRARQFLGIEAAPAVDASGAPGMRITKVNPGSAAERVGLHVGDVIRSINDYATLQSGNLEWIYVNAAPNNILRINAFTQSDGSEHTFTTQIP